MRAILIVLFAALSGVALGAPGDESRHATGVIKGCRLLADGKMARSNLDAMEFGVCLGLLQAIWFTGSHLQPNMRHCAPSNLSTEQVAKVFLRYADQHPERLNDGPEILAIEALRTAWPCRSN
jgi:hypothetical protein